MNGRGSKGRSTCGRWPPPCHGYRPDRADRGHLIDGGGRRDRVYAATLVPLVADAGLAYEALRHGNRSQQALID